MDNEELVSLRAIGAAAWQWSNTKDFDGLLDRAEWQLVEAVESYRKIKAKQRKERESNGGDR